ncbi:aldose 1-epimerase [Lutimonas halocynthiae]|uniref:aldose epimerase family protein n=1 Tax=Lutimonas halocynthiae TaxID=1446477 RepID=UPI0025B291F9|nr:aldose 1-epimerase [Lutimonas halocynthiae]MDN3643935.1 aldose 1-epimerase [Lutimonas halocynthiae]
MNQQVITSPDKESTVVIDQGELVSYSKFGEELIHQKGDRGWGNADTEMFPIIGPTEANNFKVTTERGEAIQDQHGLLREMAYEVVDHSRDTLVCKKVYKKNTKIENSKYPAKSSEQWLSWPYDFEFKKIFSLNDEKLSIEFEVDGEKGMPFMLGYHPAFRLSGHNTEKIMANDKEIKLQDVLDAGAIAFKVLDSSEIKLIKEQGYHIQLETEGFHNFMLWTEVKGMLCIEPITAYPYTAGKLLDKSLFKACDGTAHFKVNIKPFK